MGVLDPYDAALDALDAIALVAKLEDVAGHALDREILIHRADEMVLGLEQHLIVRVVRYGAAGGERGEPRAPPAAQHVIDGVMVDQGTAPPAAGAEAFGEHADDGCKILSFQRAIGPGAANELIELILIPGPGTNLCGDLLRQHVERLLRNGEAIKLAAPDAVEKRCAFDQFVARERKQSALGRARNRVAGAPDSLQEGRDRTR